MGPKRVITSKKQMTVVSSSSTPRARSFNRGKLLGPEQEDKYKELFNRNIWEECTFNIDPEGNFRDCAEIIEERKWQKLANSPTNLNYEIVCEFYANDIPI